MTIKPLCESLVGLIPHRSLTAFILLQLFTEALCLCRHVSLPVPKVYSIHICMYLPFYKVDLIQTTSRLRSDLLQSLRRMKHNDRQTNKRVSPGRKIPLHAQVTRSIPIGRPLPQLSSSG